MRQETAAGLPEEINIGSASEGGIENFNSEVYDKLNEKLRDPEIAQLAVELRDHIDGQIEGATNALESKRGEVNQEEAALVAQLESQGLTGDLAQLKKDLAPIKGKEAKLDHTFKDLYKRFVTILFLERSFSKKNKGDSVKPNSFQNREVAAQQLKETGLTDERKPARTILSKLLYKVITPYGYRPPSELLDMILMGLYREDPARETMPDREDAWRLYLGLPQENDTFGVSNYKPEKSKEDKYYYKINNWFEKFNAKNEEEDVEEYSTSEAIKKVVSSLEWTQKYGVQYEAESALRNDFVKRLKKTEEKFQKLIEKFSEENGISPSKDFFIWDDGLRSKFNTENSGNKYVREYLALEEEWGNSISNSPERINRPKGYWQKAFGANHIIAYDDVAKSVTRSFKGVGVMGDYKIQKGKDEKGSYISYYDRWNLGPTIEGENGLLGNPFELYDRIYYDPVTFEPIP